MTFLRTTAAAAVSATACTAIAITAACALGSAHLCRYFVLQPEHHAASQWECTTDIMVEGSFGDAEAYSLQSQ